MVNITSAHQLNKEHYDKETLSLNLVGDLVWLHVSAVKLGRTKTFALQWKGPYTIIDRTCEVNYKLKLVGSSVKPLIVQHNWLKPCYGIPIHSTLASTCHLYSAPLYSDVVQCSSMAPVGGYASISVPSDCISWNQQRCGSRFITVTTFHIWLWGHKVQRGGNVTE